MAEQLPKGETTIDVARGIIALLGPITGVRATGQLEIVPKYGTEGTIYLPANKWLYPVVNEGLRTDLAYRVLPNLDRLATGADWEIPIEGSLVDVEAHVGGEKFNLEPGTVMRWADDEPEGFDGDSATVGEYGIVGGDSEFYYGSDLLRTAAIFESMGSTQLDLNMFRAGVFVTPAAVLVWEGSDTPIAAGRGAFRITERWTVLLIVSKADNDSSRRGIGLRLLDRICDCLAGQSIYGDEEMKGVGIIVSTPELEVRGRRRIRGAGDNIAWQQNYVYSVSIETGRVVSKIDFRDFNPWLRSRIQVFKPEKNLPYDEEPLLMADVEVEMPQDDDE